MIEIMTQQEFEDRTSKTVTSEEYARIEAMYMAAGNMDKDQFCTEYKKHGSSAIVAEYYRRITVLNGMLEERNNELDDARQNRTSLAEFLLGKAAAYDDTDFYREAVRLIGRKAATLYKIKSGLPLWEEDIRYLEEKLAD